MHLKIGCRASGMGKAANGIAFPTLTSASMCVCACECGASTFLKRAFRECTRDYELPSITLNGYKVEGFDQSEGN